MKINYNFIKAFLALILVWPNLSFAGSVTMPTSLVADTSSFVSLSDSGTTPSISDYTGTLLVSVTASDGNIKVTTTTNLKRAKGYCGYTADNDNEPTDCTGNSLTEIGFRGTQDDINTALATLAFKGDGTTGSPTVTLSVTPAGSLYNSANGHYYEVVDNGGNITWYAAKTAAEASTFNGLSGYLASITTKQENDFIYAKAGENAWLGGTDRNAEGCWKWSGGPDDGKIFTNDGGVANCVVDDGYTVYIKPFGAGEFGWNSGEPNNAGVGGEDRLHMKTDGTWNDFINNNSNVEYYVIEYGGMPGETATTSGLTTLTIKSVEASGSTFNAFDDKQLKGIVEAHNESIKSSLTQSTNSVLRRMEQYRRIGNNQSVKIQDLKIALNDISNNENIGKKLFDHYSKEALEKIKIKDYISSNLTSMIGSNSNPKYNDWVWWASGSINKGSLNFRSDQLGRETDSDGFIIGADIDYDNNSLFGLAFRTDDNITKVSTNGTTSSSNGKNLMMYHTLKIDEQNFIDTFFGIGETDQYTNRVVDVSNNLKVTGFNEARHIFGAVKYNYFSSKLKIFNISNYSRISFGYSEIDGYTESGSSNLKMNFDDRDLLSSAATIGIKIDKGINLNYSNILPYLKFDYSEDLTEDSVLKGNYVSTPSNQYSTSISKDFSSSLRLEAGFDWLFDNGWRITTIVNRREKNGFGHENELAFSAHREF